jgi:RNA 2',3'-cyclic 3'-phosphodiesterase
MRTRTFVAVTITDEVRERALELMRRLQPVAGDVNWVAAENLHWTLQFLGDVEDTLIPEVCDCVGGAVAGLEPFELTAFGAGAFPSAARPRTLWLGAGQGADDMVALQAAIERRLRKLGYRGEARRFVPHLTLGRAGRSSRPRSLADELAALADFYAGAMLVDEVTVFASQLGREGPEYRVLGRAPIGA